MCPRAAETGLQVTTDKGRRLAFLLGCIHCAREAVAARLRAPVTCRFPATKVDARTAARLPDVRPRCVQGAPALHCLPRRSPAPRTVRKMEARARGAPTPASLCALQAAGLAQGPTPSPRHAGTAWVSGLRAATLAPATAYLPHFEPKRRTSRAARGAGPGSQAATASLPRAPAL